MLRFRPMKRDVKDTHVYFPVKLLAELKRMAAANRRTVSAEIVMAVERSVSEWKKPKFNPITDKRDINAW